MSFGADSANVHRENNSIGLALFWLEVAEKKLAWTWQPMIKFGWEKFIKNSKIIDVD